jgi:AraC-like DNA-binding protein
VNDATGSAAAALALAAVERYVPRGAETIPRIVLGGGLSSSSVKELGVRLHRNRTSIERSMRRASAPAPSAMLDLAKAAYAVALLRSTQLSLEEIAQATRFSRASVLRACVRRVFALDIGGLGTVSPEMNPNDFLRHLVRGKLRGVSGPLTPPRGTPRAGTL